MVFLVINDAVAEKLESRKLNSCREFFIGMNITVILLILCIKQGSYLKERSWNVNNVRRNECGK
jgi:hypothetical protein